MTILDDLPGIVAQSVGTLLFNDLNVIRVAQNASDGRGGFVETKTTYAGRGLVTEFSDFKRMVGDLPPHARQVILQAQGLAITPTRGDLVELSGKCWKLTEVSSPPGQPVFECVAEPTELSISGDLAEITGSLSQTLEPIGFSAGSLGTRTGALSVTLADIGQNIVGTVPALGERTGGVSQTLGDIVPALAGAALVQGVLSQQLQTIQSTAAANNPISGAVAQTLQPIGFVAAGGSGAFGSLAQTLQPIVSGLAGDVDVGGGASETMGAIGFVASAEVVVTGTVSQTLQTIQSTAGGDVDIVGDAGQTLQPIGFSATADNPVAAVLSQTLQPIGFTASGTVDVSGSAAQALAGIGFAASGTVVAAPTNEAETDALIARMTVAPSTAREAVINAFIKGLKDDGLWAKLDFLKVYFAHDEQASTLDWKDNAGDDVYRAGDTFVTDAGIDNDSTNFTGWLTGVTLSTHASAMTTTQGHVGIWVGNMKSSGFSFLGADVGDNFYELGKGGTTANVKIGSSAIFSPASAIGAGPHHLVLTTRSAGVNVDAYVDGSDDYAGTTARGGTLLSTSEWQIGTDNHQCRTVCFHGGGELDATENANLNSRISTFLTDAVGT